LPTAVHYPAPLHHQSAYAALCRQATDFIVSERVANQVLSSPMPPYLDDDTANTVVRALDALEWLTTVARFVRGFPLQGKDRRSNSSWLGRRL